MKVEIDVKNDTSYFEIAKYINNDSMYEEQEKTLRKLSQKSKTLERQSDKNKSKHLKLLEKLQHSDSANKNCKQLAVEVINNILNDVNETPLIRMKMAEIKNGLNEIKVHRELKSTAEKIIERFENEVEDLKKDIQLMNKIVNEENTKNCNSAYINLEEYKFYFSINPVIDLNITDRIVIIDFIVYPLCLDLDTETKKDELN